MNLNQVCLCFQAYYRNEADNRWEKICEPVYSNTINNMKSALTGELRITRMSSMASLAAGGEEIYLFVEKVCKSMKLQLIYNLKYKLIQLNYYRQHQSAVL